MKLLTKTLLTSTALFAVYQAHATCDIASPPAAGSTVTCSGSTTGIYRVTTQNVTVTNEGIWSGSLPNNTGSVFGASYGSNTDTDGLKFVNNGSMDINVSSFGSGYAGATVSAVSVNWRSPFANLSGTYATENNGSISFIDTATASATDVTVIANAYYQGQGTITNSTGSTISVTSNNNYTTAIASSGNGSVINNGIINATSKGFAQARGVNLISGFSPTYTPINTTANFLNTGEVYTTVADIDTTLGSISFGSAAVWVSLVQRSTVENQGILSFDMSGTFTENDEVGTVLFSDAYAKLLGGSVDYLTNTFINSGEVRTIGHDIAINSVFDIGNAPSIIVQNKTTGLIDGRIFTSSEIDTIQNYGEITGKIMTREGDDLVFLLNDSKTADVDLGDGSDILRIVAPTSLGLLDGGDDIERADGFSDQLYIDSYIGSTINYVNFEDVNITNGSEVDFGDSYTSPDSITFNVDNTSTVTMTGGGAGNYTINAGVENNGLFDFSDDIAGDHLTITGNGSPTAIAASIGDLSGTGSYRFDTDFENKVSDYITVNGNVTANGTIEINDITSASYDAYNDTTQGQSEAAKAANGEILLIEAPNDNDKSDESFILATRHQYGGNTNRGRFTNSPFVWELKTSGNDWVLDYASDTRDDKPNPQKPKPPKPLKPSIVAEIPAYTSLPTIAREVVMSELDTLHTRLGELRNNQGWVGTGSSNIKTNLGTDWHNAIGFDDSKMNAWLKGTINSFDFGTDSSFDVSGTYGGFNLGIDKKFDLPANSPNWSAYTGLFGGYKTGSFETSGKGSDYTSNERADIDLDTWSIGGYATFYNTAGTYIDLVAEYMDLSADIDAAGLKSSTDGYGLSGSIEVGHSFDLAKDIIIEPQAQLKIAHINWDDLNDGTNDVYFEGHTYVMGRTGLRVEKTIETSQGEIKPWAYLGVVHEFTDAPEVTYAATVFDAHDYSTAGEIKVGITADVMNTVQLYADAGYSTDFNDYNAAKGDLGVRVSW